MPKHIIVDGSNIATEGRSAPSLKQLDEAVLAFKEEHPEALITVVVDATFGHRIDSKEVAEFDSAVNNNELVAPPAGAVGRGDAFVLGIANKVKATILSNDSYQEFHGQYPWLFDEGRLIGGKPVPHVGWVFVPRIPVRGPLSRKAVSESKRKSRGGEKTSKRQASAEANKPMPVPTAPPPNATLPKKTKPAAELAAAEHVSSKNQGANELLPYLSFVERHPLGTAVAAVVERYSSHGAYVTIDDVVGYLPLRLMSDPPPRSAREFVDVGETVSLVIESYVPARRSIDLASPAMASARPPSTRQAAKRATKKAVAESIEAAEPLPALLEAEVTPEVSKAAKAAKPAKRTRTRAGAEPAPPPPVPEPETVAPVKRTRKKAATAVEPLAAPAEQAPPSAPPKAVKRASKKAPVDAPPAPRKRAAKKAAAS